MDKRQITTVHSMEAKLELWRQRKSLEGATTSCSSSASNLSMHSPVKKRPLSTTDTAHPLSPRPSPCESAASHKENRTPHVTVDVVGIKTHHNSPSTGTTTPTFSPVSIPRTKIPKSSLSPAPRARLDLNSNSNSNGRDRGNTTLRPQNPTKSSKTSLHPFEGQTTIQLEQIIQNSIAKEMTNLKEMIVQTLVEQRVAPDEQDRMEMAKKEMSTKRATECFKALQHLRERVEFNSHHHMYDKYIREIEKETSLLDDNLEIKLEENSALNFEKEILSQQLEQLNQKEEKDPEQQQVIERLRQENMQMYEEINTLRNQYGPALEKASRKLNELHQELDETKEQKRVAMQMLADQMK